MELQTVAKFHCVKGSLTQTEVPLQKCYVWQRRSLNDGHEAERAEGQTQQDEERQQKQ